MGPGNEVTDDYYIALLATNGYSTIQPDSSLMRYFANMVQVKLLKQFSTYTPNMYSIWHYDSTCTQVVYTLCIIWEEKAAAYWVRN